MNCRVARRVDYCMHDQPSRLHLYVDRDVSIMEMAPRRGCGRGEGPVDVGWVGGVVMQSKLLCYGPGDQ